MIVNIDIETIPQQGAYDSFLSEAKSNFKASSTLTKAKACDDLGITGSDAKYLGKDDAIAKWVSRFAEEKAPEVAENEWRKTALDGSKGQICSIAFAIEDNKPEVVWSKDLTMECDILSKFVTLLNDRLGGRKPFFVGHNIGGFDLKFIYQRCVINGVKPSFALPFNGRHDVNYYDTCEAWAGFGKRISQDNLCKALGIEGKPDDIDGSKVWDFVRDGQIERVAEYNVDDVVKNREIYKRLNFINKIGQ